MISGGAGGDKVSERLHESLARLRKDIDSVELWASALEGFSQPIPDYEAGQRHRLPPGKAAEQSPADVATRETNGSGKQR